MNSVQADDAAVVQQTPQQRADALPLRRPRVREVSSRFMSPLVPSNPIPTPNTNSKIGECQRSKSVQRRHHEDEESHTDKEIQNTTRSLESTPMIEAFGSHNQNIKAGGVAASSNSLFHKKYQPQGKRFKENNGASPKAAQLLHPSDVASQSKGSSSHFGGGGRISRPDTPTLLIADRDRIVPSRYRIPSQSCHRPSPSNLNSGLSATSAAAKLLQEATSGSRVQTAGRTSNGSIDAKIANLQKKSSSVWGSKSGTSSYSDMCSGTATAASTQQGGSCPNSPVCVSSNKNRTLSDVRSSMPEVDTMQISTRWLADKNSISFHGGESCNDFRSSTCARSLNLTALSSTEHWSCNSSSWHSLRASDLTETYTPSRALVKNPIGNVSLPPHPSCIKLGIDARKGRKHFTHQEETHSLKLLHNHYLQWRFANAKAEASMHVQKVETEVSFSQNYSYADFLFPVNNIKWKLAAEWKSGKQYKINCSPPICFISVPSDKFHFLYFTHNNLVSFNLSLYRDNLIVLAESYLNCEMQ